LCMSMVMLSVIIYHFLHLWIIIIAIPLTIVGTSEWTIPIMMTAMYLLKKYGKNKATLWIDSLLIRLEKSGMKVSDKDRYEKSKKPLLHLCKS